jgi:hypothetical protein
LILLAFILHILFNHFLQLHPELIYDFLFAWFFLWMSLTSLVIFIIILLVLEIRNSLSSFPIKSSVELFFGGLGFPCLILLPMFLLCDVVPCYRLVLWQFNHLFSFSWCNHCVVTSSVIR